MITFLTLWMLVGLLAATGSICWLAAMYHDWDVAMPDRPNDFTPKTLFDVLVGPAQSTEVSS